MKFTQDEFNELCNAGKLHKQNKDYYSIKWLTFFQHLCACIDADEKKCSLVRFEIGENNTNEKA